MRILITLVSLVLFSSCQSDYEENNIAIVIHGGAGTILKENMTPELELAYIQKLEEAVKTGYQILQKGGTSQNAVEETIKIMENSPLFNAGLGAVLTNDETVSLDASFMEGSNLNAGAIAGSQYIKNPISAAISVMNDSPHVLLSSEGADEFAIRIGLFFVRRAITCIVLRISSSRPITGSSFPFLAISVRSRVYFSRAPPDCSVLFKLLLFLAVIDFVLNYSFNLG